VSNVDNKLKKSLLFISAILGITFLVSGVLLLSQIDMLLGDSDVEEEEEVEVVEDQPPEVEERIIDPLPESDGYILRRNATEYQIELFEILVNAHDQFDETGSDEDLKDYAAAIVRNFVADFFTLSNKNSRSDVGGLQFFSEEVEDNFRNFAVDEFYLYLNQHIEIFGSELLPTVVSTTILDVEFGTRFVETDDEDEDEDVDLYDMFAAFDEVTPSGEEIEVIVIDIEWSYGSSTLQYIDEFQTAARFILVQHDDGVSIYVIELPEMDDEGYG